MNCPCELTYSELSSRNGVLIFVSSDLEIFLVVSIVGADDLVIFVVSVGADNCPPVRTIESFFVVSFAVAVSGL